MAGSAFDTVTCHRDVVSIPDVVNNTESKQYEHIVEENETISSIAAKYDTTPCELARTNRMQSASFVFVGQCLKLPTKVNKSISKERTAICVVEEEEIFDQQCVKINARYITDGSGIVLGSLLFTPKTLMFNPNPTDPLVDDSPDYCIRFQLIAPMELVVNIVLFYDFYVFGCGVKDDVETDVKYYSDTDEVLPENDTFYLRLTMGKPIAKKLSRSTPVMSNGEQNLDARYWFVVKPSKVQRLYAFFITWFPELYGLFRLSQINCRGYELISLDRPFLEAEAGRTCNRETVSRIIHRTMTLNDIDVDLLMPEVVGGHSELISDDLRKNLLLEFPMRLNCTPWHLLYSTSSDGFSLHTIYRRSLDFECPVLLVIRDMFDNVFGAFISLPMQMCEHFKGTGESFLFQLKPKWNIFRWTGENEYFLKGDKNSVIIGSGNGKFGLWLDEDLNQGRSQTCSTFDNNPLSSHEDFTIHTLEYWAFID